MNNLFATALAGNNCNLTVAFSTVTNLFTFTDNTTSNTFTLLSTNSTCLAAMGISQVDHVSTPNYVNSTCTLVSPCIIDLSGNNSFYFTTNLATENYNFVRFADRSGSNIFEKIQFASDSTGTEFFKNINQFKTRFSDKNITNINIVLLDENYNQWIPKST